MENSVPQISAVPDARERTYTQAEHDFGYHGDDPTMSERGSGPPAKGPYDPDRIRERTAAAHSPTPSDADTPPLTDEEMRAWLRQTVGEAYHGSANLAHTFEECGDPFCVEAFARMEQVLSALDAVRATPGLREALTEVLAAVDSIPQGATSTEWVRFQAALLGARAALSAPATTETTP